MFVGEAFFSGECVAAWLRGNGVYKSSVCVGSAENTKMKVILLFEGTNGSETASRKVSKE